MAMGVEKAGSSLFGGRSFVCFHKRGRWGVRRENRPGNLLLRGPRFGVSFYWGYICNRRGGDNLRLRY